MRALRRIIPWVAVVVFLAAAFPQVVQAASAAFSSASAGTPAAYGVNSAVGGIGVKGYSSATTLSGDGVRGEAKSHDGHGVIGIDYNTSGLAWGIKGQSYSDNGRGAEGYASSTSYIDHQGVVGTVKGGGTHATSNISGVWGQALGDTGWTNGVFGVANGSNPDGVGVRALAESGVGVVAEGSVGSISLGAGLGALGFGQDGSFSGLEGVNCSLGTDQQGNCITGTGVYGVVSDDDLGVSGHLLGSGTNMAGTCVVPNATAVTASECMFQEPWPMGGSRPLVTATPEADPGSYYWVEMVNDGSSYTGIRIHTGSAVSADTTFDYHVIGVDSSISPAARQKAAAERRFARYGG